VFNVGPLEIVLVLVIALIVLGPQRLPDVARSVGRGMREFRSALASGANDDDDDEPDEGEDEGDAEVDPEHDEDVEPRLDEDEPAEPLPERG
jgi:sec-independent protein translocase protein TatA